MKNIDILKDHASGGRANIIFAFPFVIALFVCTFYLKLPQEYQNSDLAFLNNPSRLISLGLAYLIALILVVKRFQKSLFIFKKNKIFIVLMLYFLSSVLWSSYPSKVIINWGHITGLTLTIISLLQFIGKKHEKIFFIFSGYAFVAVSVSLILCVFLPERGIYSINGRWMGVTTNPNSLGAICLVSVWANLSCIGLYSQKGLRLFCFLTILITLIVLWGTNSITSIVCCLFIFGSMNYFRIIRKNSTSKIIIKLFLLMVISTSIILFIAIIRPELLSIDVILSEIGRNNKLTGRVVLWDLGFKLFHTKPWFGWGFDSLASALTNLTKQKIDTGQFHNGYIDLCIRGGIIGAGFVAALLLKFLVDCIAVTKQNAQIGTSYLILVFSILLHNFTEASLLRSTHLLWILFLLSFFSTSYIKHLSKYSYANSRKEIWRDVNLSSSESPVREAQTNYGIGRL